MLRGHNISFARGDKTLFTNLSLNLKAGEKLTVKGANGSGKSTLLRLLAGLLPSRVGTLLWEGTIISKANLGLYQQQLLYIGHRLCLHPQAHVSDQLKLWKNLHTVSLCDLEHALSVWGLEDVKDKKIAHLSQGQQKRLSLSRCHWMKRSLWILDEPESGLDEAGLMCLTKTMTLQVEQGRSIVHATHNPKELMKTIILGEDFPIDQGSRI